MFEDVEISRDFKPEAHIARQLLHAFDLSADAVSVERIRQAFGRRITFGNELIKCESAQFIERARSTGFKISADFERTSGDLAASAVNAEPARPAWLINYIPRLLPAGEKLLTNIRFENVGSLPMFRNGDGRTSVAARWYTKDGELYDGPDIRTSLPIDVMPNKALTLPVWLATPSAEGRYRLAILMVEEGVRWLEDDVLSVPVEVIAGYASAIPAGWQIGQEESGYDEDHRRATLLLQSWLDEYAPDRPRILEIGGNAIPMIERLDGELHNVDVDLRGLQVCSLRQRKHGRSMTIVCADACNLPYEPDYFDAIVIFASLHHFPEPAKLLAALRGRLKRTGFMAVMCEPVGHAWPGAMLPSFVAELERGVNEQSFSVAEYAKIFRMAELETDVAIVDKNSLKARLTVRSMR